MVATIVRYVTRKQGGGESGHAQATGHEDGGIKSDGAAGVSYGLCMASSDELFFLSSLYIYFSLVAS